MNIRKGLERLFRVISIVLPVLSGCYMAHLGSIVLHNKISLAGAEGSNAIFIMCYYSFLVSLGIFLLWKCITAIFWYIWNGFMPISYE